MFEGAKTIEFPKYDNLPKPIKVIGIPEGATNGEVIADMQYIKECAESVGMDVTDRTAFSIPFIAEVMRKMREQSNSDEDCISFPKGTLKKRGKGYVVYNPEWLKENWQTELKVMGIEPSVQLKPKTGYWEWVQYDSNPEIGNFHCSECNFMPASFNWASKHLKYCPNCGAKMEDYEET